MIFHANSSGQTISTLEIGSRISSTIPWSIISDQDLTTIRDFRISHSFVKRGFSSIVQKIPSACSKIAISSGVS
jgi:hypothetical protein